jgi:chromosome segregation ATPase
MAEETVLLDIQIPKGAIEQATAEIGKARAEIDKLREANKQMTDKSSEAFTKNAIKIKKANEGSIEQLRAQLSTVTSEWVKLSKEERENTEQGKKLSKQKLALTNELKRLEKQTGDTRRNVGNYSEGVKEALQQSGLFTKQQQAAQQVFNIYNTTLNTISKTFNKYTQVNAQATVSNTTFTQSAETATGATAAQATATTAATRASGGFSKALKVLKIALISTGIGAIVVAVGSLVAAFLSTQRGVDALNKVLKPITFAFQRLIGVFQKVATALADLNFEKAINELLGIGEALKQGAEDGRKFAESTIELENARLKLAENEGRLNRKFQEQKALIQDVTKADDERRAAGEEAIQALEERAALERKILEEQRDLAKLKADQNNSDRETLIELAELNGAIDQLKADTDQRSLEIRNQINSLDKAAANERIREAEELKKLREEEEAERLKAAELKKKELQESIQQNLKEEIDAAIKLAEEQIRIEGERFLASEISREEYNKRIEELELESLQAQKELREQYGQDATALEDRILAHKIANKEVDVDTTVIAEESKKQTTEATIAALASQMNKESAAAKLLSSAQTAISTYKAATAALEPPPVGLGPVLGPILAGLTTINGLANVAKINAIQLPKFATGVIGVDGPGTGTSDSINAKISAGESVITAKTTSAYAPLLASLEASMGNRPNIGNIGRAKFANGVINAGMNVSRQAAQVSMNETSQLASSITQMPIFLSLTELEDEQAKYNRAKAQAQIVE